MELRPSQQSAHASVLQASGGLSTSQVSCWPCRHLVRAHTHACAQCSIMAPRRKPTVLRWDLPVGPPPGRPS
eukprot:2214677-Alexandrium_andersonii.AAC.1